MSNLLLAYSTADGQTLRICSRLCKFLEAEGHSISLFEITEESHCELTNYETVVVGASVRYGKHRKSAVDFVKSHRNELDCKPCAFFSVNVVARKAGKDTPATNAYVRAFLQQTGWRPTLLGVFPGRIDYPKYRFLDRQVIRFIMWLTDGPTDPTSCTEFTDWQAVDAFGAMVARLGGYRDA
jgi:menaquinone-dependent protoporphyrinogen oxidase